MSDKKNEIVHDLTKTLEGKEIEIFNLLCQNLSNRQISEQMQMPLTTVCWNLRRIYKKLGVDTDDPKEYYHVRRRAMMYAGTRIEQVVRYESEGERGYSIKEIKTAAKRAGIDGAKVENLISFLEMETD